MTQLWSSGSRTGRTAKVSVQTSDQADIDATGEVPGTFSVFDLHPTDTKFYIGGVPENSGVSTSDISLNSKHLRETKKHKISC